MKIKMIKCTRYEDQADRWTAFTDCGAYPYSKNFKDKTINSWLDNGHIVGHKTIEDGAVEIWTLID